MRAVDYDKNVYGNYGRLAAGYVFALFTVALRG